ncbi:MAG: hypothetical protein NT126_05710 [Bacteroidetes bacterium]|nr:hypothetical protein [Bacteroidota bacterium]
MTLRTSLLLLLIFLFTSYSKAQDTIVLLSGKTIVASSIEYGGYAISYKGMKAGSRMKRIGSENIFSIIHPDGSERIMYQPDSIDETDFNVEQMRMFIRGEQDAMKYYKNNLNKAVAFFCGGGSSLFAIYGLVGPAIYSTASGSFSPDISKQKVSDPLWLHADEYREGYERKIRDKKIRNSILYGFAGFAVGFTTFRFILKK